MRKEITGVSQFPQESLYEYWSRLKTLMNSCPNHNCKKVNLVQHFYDDLLPHLNMSIDAASNGSIFNLSVNEGWNLLDTMANNQQQFYGRDALNVNEAPSISNDVKMTNFFDKFVTGWIGWNAR